METIEKTLKERIILVPSIKKEFKFEQNVHDTINNINGKFLVEGFDDKTFYSLSFKEVVSCPLEKLKPYLK